MSIASEITRINGNIAAAYTALDGKGATLPETQNSANLADTIDTITTGGGGGSGVYRGNWLVPQEYIALDEEVTRIHDTLNPIFTAGFYFNKTLSNMNKFVFNNNNLQSSFRCFSSNGEKTITTNEDFSGYSEVTMSNDEDYLIFTFSHEVGSAYFCAFFLVSNYSSNSTFHNNLLSPQRSAMKYITAKGAVASSETFSVVQYVIPNLDEAHVLTNGMFKTYYNRLKYYTQLKYIPSTTEYTYTDTYSDTNGAFKIIARLPNLPDGGDFSNITADWNFGDTMDNYPMYINNIKLNRMYITLPKSNITFNNSLTDWTKYGINLTADNWTYIAEHAPTVSGKTIKISPYNESQLGATNKALLESKGWTVSVISS